MPIGRHAAFRAVTFSPMWSRGNDRRLSARAGKRRGSGTAILAFVVMAVAACSDGSASFDTPRSSSWSSIRSTKRCHTPQTWWSPAPAEVQDSKPFTVDTGIGSSTYLVTPVQFEVIRVLSGNLTNGSVITVQETGGTLGEHTLADPGSPVTLEGSTNLLFLVGPEGDETYYTTLGAGNGRFYVDSAGRLTPSVTAGEYAFGLNVSLVGRTVDDVADEVSARS